MTKFDQEAKHVRHDALPGYYDDLDGSLAQAWAMIARGAADRRSAFHTPVVATIDETGSPCQRVMVLRAAHVTQRALRLHTDRRSAKMRHLQRHPHMSVLFYDVGAKLQLRLQGRVQVHCEDAIAHEAWLASRPQSRLCYEQADAPGTPIDAPYAELPVDQRFAATDAGEKNFSAVIVTIDRLEWLFLAIEGHRRARWDWRQGQWQGAWLAP